MTTPKLLIQLLALGAHAGAPLHVLCKPFCRGEPACSPADLRYVFAGSLPLSECILPGKTSLAPTHKLDGYGSRGMTCHVRPTNIGWLLTVGLLDPWPPLVRSTFSPEIFCYRTAFCRTQHAVSLPMQQPGAIILPPTPAPCHNAGTGPYAPPRSPRR